MVAEIYQMSSPQDAFGLFTQDTDGEEASLVADTSPFVKNFVALENQTAVRQLL